MTERKWMPADYMEEVPPPMVAAPLDYIQALPGGDAFALKSPYHDKPEEESEREWKFEPLARGSQVGFVFFETYDNVEVTIQPDGSYTVDGVVDPRATQFCAWGEPETMAYSMDDFAKEYAANEAPGSLPMRIDVWCYQYSDTINFMFDVVDGKPSLVECGQS